MCWNVFASWDMLRRNYVLKLQLHPTLARIFIGQIRRFDYCVFCSGARTHTARMSKEPHHGAAISLPFSAQSAASSSEMCVEIAFLYIFHGMSHSWCCVCRVHVGQCRVRACHFSHTFIIMHFSCLTWNVTFWLLCVLRACTAVSRTCRPFLSWFYNYIFLMFHAERHVLGAVRVACVQGISLMLLLQSACKTPV